jgi:hypothetical protein
MLLDPLPKPKDKTFAIICLVLDLWFPGFGMLIHQFTGEPEGSWLIKSIIIIIITCVCWATSWILIGFIGLIILWIITIINNIAIIKSAA